MHKIIKEDLETIARSLQGEAQRFAGKTVLISGGAGFLGSYIVGTFHILNKNTLTKPCRIISVDNYITGSKDSFIHELAAADTNIHSIVSDVTKPFEIDESIHFIIHAAGLASPYYYKKYPLETIEVAVSGVKNLLELARSKNVESFLLFSSSEVYGDPDPNFIPTPETYRGNVSSVGPRSCYDESKRLAETIAVFYHEIFGVPIKIVRPFNVYGPGMKYKDYRVVPTFLTRAIAAQALPVHDKGNQTRTFCYVTDAVAGFLKVLASQKNGEIYNVGTDREEINMMSLAMAVSELFGGAIHAKLIQYPESYPADEPQRRCPDLTKIRRELGYHPTVDLKTGLSRTLAWFRDSLPQNFSLM